VQLKLELEQGPSRIEVVHDAVALDVETATTVVTSQGKNTFGVAHDPNANVTYVAAYAGTVAVQPQNRALAPVTLQPGQQVRVTQDNMSAPAPIPLPMPPFGQAEPYTNTPGMAIQAAQRQVGVGELVDVPVWLIKGNNVANINYELTYNANVARPEGTIRKGYLLDNALFSVNPNTSGIIRVGFAQATGINGTGPVTYIPFRATGKVGDRTPLSLAVTTINNPTGATLAIDRIPGEIVIVGPGVNTPGDCAGDGGPLTMFDAMCALQMSVKLISTRLVMDMDNSGDVTSRDAAIIAQKYTGLIP
jgi:hypothetical protein